MRPGPGGSDAGALSVADPDQRIPDHRHEKNHGETTHGPLSVKILVHRNLREEVPQALDFMDEKRGLLRAEILHHRTADGTGETLYRRDLIHRCRWLVKHSSRQMKLKRLFPRAAPFLSLGDYVVREAVKTFPTIDRWVGVSRALQDNHRPSFRRCGAFVNGGESAGSC